MNRKKRASRGNMSPIELTTGIQPRSVAEMIYRGGKGVEVIDEQASLSLNEAIRRLITLMEDRYDKANMTRRAKSEKNREKNGTRAIPDITIGDFVLYAKPKKLKETKLDYTWLEPAVVTDMVTPLVLTIRPVSYTHLTLPTICSV